jgi:hypothetical protein
MHETIRAHFQALGAAVQGTTIPADRQQVIATSIRRLSALYTQFRQTSESRYGEEITRVVQAVLKELEACPEARKLDAAFREGLRQLHEQVGLPALTLKPPAAPPKPRKTRKK